MRKTKGIQKAWKKGKRLYFSGTSLCAFASVFFILGALLGVVLFLNIMDTDDRLKYVALDRSKHMIAFIGVIALNAIGLILVLIGRFRHWKGLTHMIGVVKFTRVPEAPLLSPESFQVPRHISAQQIHNLPQQLNHRR